MSTDHDDDGLAPVTDLFGARSRRRAPVSPAMPDIPAPPVSPDEPRDADGWALPGPDDVRPDEAPTAFDADTPVPLPLHGARGPAAWVSPVIGDGSGRSARSEQDGYASETADATTASVFSIAGGEEIDPADAPRPLDEQRADAERLSLRALGRKGVSESEMRTLLLQQDLDPDVVEHEIERLTRVGLLDDVALATDLVDRLHARKGLGRQGVVTELRRRGIDQVAIDTALDEAADDEDDEFLRAQELADKRAPQMRGLDRATAERRLSGFLMRKGYSSGVVRIAVERALGGGGKRPRPGGGTVRFE
ncbi:regulatory protein RecX [Curtobacterium aurantiacum]|uniref:Regulatory protein RecX n=1 Tax=Curtobacterium aurantiacum TaxID=3236919 RepID=A0ABS5VB70_9MICO|nr:regulatory protein RecX [Curtobacterium flaccumfaciens]MBT1544091.1 recombination regulator RecX [Curtobacterium flaccumfaciens pv. flaccumfaciens]MBT1586724.1 recombination regulator RecX [Curtobacterium flaccumfaciens pv. flaccumfaciens]MBT1676424.1 recombination regulator RecX [Curtobacterium flaccumfaciens pv. flaccumfaciens]